MSTGTGIEWTEATWNPVVGCTRASAGCDHCYAVTMTKRLAAMGQPKYVGLVNEGKSHFNGVVRTVEDALTIPLRWKKPRRVFVNSMSDLFHEAVPFDFIDRVFAVMALTPQHTYQVLTKRPERMAEYLDSRRRSITFFDDGARSLGYTLRFDTGNGHPLGLVKWPLPNVWMGCSVENQQTADERIPHLLRCPAAVRFISAEPLLGPVDLGFECSVLTDLMDMRPDRDERHRGAYPFTGCPPEAVTRRKHWIHWLIVGGESGPGARPLDVAWIRSLVRKCKDAGVACFVKQFGARPDIGGFAMLNIRDPKGGDPSEWPEDLRVREFPTTKEHDMTATKAKPIRVQRRRSKGWKMPPNTVYVGRPTKWGNPFKVTDDRTRSEVVIAYRTWLLIDGCHAGFPEQKREIVHSIRELRGKNLACFCPLDQPCHADVLLEIANSEEPGDA